MSEIKLQTGAGVFEVLAHVCRSPLEAFKQFVENGADAIEQVGQREGRISVCLEGNSNGHQPAAPGCITVADNGIGMSPEKMQQVLQHIGDSEKLDSSLRGEKGIGILAFALIADELHLCSAGNGRPSSSCLVLRRDGLKAGLAQFVEHCPSHQLPRRGTKAHLMGISPEMAAKFSKARLKDYLGREFASDLRQGLYSLVLQEGHHYEPVQPHLFRGGLCLDISLPLGSFGHASVQLYALPLEAVDAGISLCGRGGTRICHLVELEDFRKEPWTDKRLEGYVRCDQLKRTADKTAVVQDDAYRALVSALHSLSPGIQERIQQVTQEYQQQRFGEISQRVDRFITRFLRYLEGSVSLQQLGPRRGEAARLQPELTKRSPSPRHGKVSPRVTTDVPHYLKFDLSLPNDGKGELRSWSDSSGSLHINELHHDFVESERDDKIWAWYLFTMWGKEHLLAQYGSDSSKLADELGGFFSKAGPLFNQYLQRS